ncbi:MAG: endopeptidase La [Bacteroidota bacterium]|nr:endopeptidase La [Bacteroidota bacterium]
MSKKNNIAVSDYFLTNNLNDDADFIPIISEEDDSGEELVVPETLPILPLRNTVLFPGIVIPITVGRDKSIKLIREAFKKDKIIGTVAQRNPNINDPAEKDLFKVGTVAQILKILDMPDNSTSVIIQGRKRFEIDNITNDEPYIQAHINVLPEDQPSKKNKEFEAIISSLKDISLRIIQLNNNVPPEAAFAIRNIESPSFLINFASSNSDIKTEEKQKLLEINDVHKRGLLLLEYLTRELQLLELKRDIQSKVKTDLDQQQREYLLHQQMKTIQDELGGNPVDQEVQELEKKAKKKKWNKEVAAVFEKELGKLERLNPAAGEYSVQLNYLHTMLELPWNEYTKDNFDLNRAKDILDKEHFGLEKVKDRILEHLAVLKLKGNMKAPILCLVGPPGVGKTSLGKSIAKALDRKYCRMSLGGLHDEAEIRGHRKTYIGAMPGRIIQNLKKVKSANPVFMLDELDKVGQDYHGDPASALLEVLDPEQNSTFNDNFLELEFDLSKVMFIATANTLGTIHPALRDRMEIIEVNGYTIEEKIEIAARHLLPKQLKEHGLKKTQFSMTKDVLEYAIENYSHESGVRQLDKTIASLIRNVAKKIAFEELYNRKLGKDDIQKILGAPKYTKDKYQGNDYAGVVTGLAWTAAGGDILFVETSLSKGKGALTLTGNLGDVMKESAVIALEYIKSHAGQLGLSPDVFEKWNIHVHVPEGAIPKDGPSAGVTMITSLGSAFTQRKVRSNLAMTGEITLRGRVLPVGGIKEKILAAKRAGITDIILCQENRKDIEEIPEYYLTGVTFHYVGNIQEVLDFALLDEKVANPLDIS